MSQHCNYEALNASVVKAGAFEILLKLCNFEPPLPDNTLGCCLSAMTQAEILQSTFYLHTIYIVSSHSKCTRTPTLEIRHNTQKVSAAGGEVALYSKHTRALTLENFCCSSLSPTPGSSLAGPALL
jgi:hypothetical protein